MYEIDGITYADNPNVIKVKQVRATDDYKLYLKFSTGEDKVFDASTLIDQPYPGVFEQLKDVDLFKRAYIDYNTVVWNEDLDVAPEYLYDYSMKVEVV